MTYGIFMWGKRGVPLWARTGNKRQALRVACACNGRVRAMRHDLGRGYWDAPTFAACSVLIKDFSNGATQSSEAIDLIYSNDEH